MQLAVTSRAKHYKNKEKVKILKKDVNFFSGKPPPRLTWWREHALLDDSYEVDNGRTTNTFVMTNIR